MSIPLIGFLPFLQTLLIKSLLEESSGVNTLNRVSSISTNPELYRFLFHPAVSIPLIGFLPFLLGVTSGMLR